MLVFVIVSFSYRLPWQNRRCVFGRRQRGSTRGIVEWTSMRPAVVPRRTQRRGRSRQAVTSTPSIWQPSPRWRSSPRGSTPTPRRQYWRASVVARVSPSRWAWRALSGTDRVRAAELRRAGSSPPVARRRRRLRCPRPTPSRWTGLASTACGPTRLTWWRFAERPSTDRCETSGRRRRQKSCSTARRHCRMTSRDRSTYCIPLMTPTVHTAVFLLGQTVTLN